MCSEKSIEEYLKIHRELTYFFHGNSMEPLLYQSRHDLVTLRSKAPGERCCKYDVALYHLPSCPERYILHRVVAVTENGYTFLGDNCFKPEQNVPEAAVVGVLKAFHRRGVTTQVTSVWYLLYSRFWLVILPLRRIWRCLQDYWRKAF